MLRFVRVVGSADTGVVLAYPTSDPQGQELLRAGFLDDVLGLFTSEALAGPDVHESHRRFDPTLSDWPELAGSPANARVRAVARACTSGEFTDLRDLARQPRHRRILEGTAAAIRVADSRLQSARFGGFDGRIADVRAVQQIVTKFGPDYTFSPSQLESFLFCPFQFFMRYVLKLQPVDERDELEEDYTERGSRVHRVLEQLERMLAQEPGNRLERAEAVIVNEMNSEPNRGSDIDLGINEIEQRRLVRTIRRYVRQHEAYESSDRSGTPVPHLFEVVFGFEESDPQSYESLKLGEGDVMVRLQGKIDRIDLVSASSVPAYRVIDYKTGSCPSKTDVKDAIYLQLPLYALAVERIVLHHAAARLHDVGYWGLAADGFKSIALKNWESDREALERYVTGVVGQLRRGLFIVDSCKDDCVHRCEYGSVCRIRQVRSARKVRDDGPSLELKV
jgi:ATP-dependent helicase/nuclease subunit B